MSGSTQLSDRIGRRMKLQDLRVFMTVMQLGSMGKAAQSLNISQPAVSKAIADLEHALGVRLFDRLRQGVEATEYGRALLDCGVTIFDELRQGVKNIEFLADPTTGEMRIGNPLISATSFIAGIIARLSRRYPRIAFHVVPGEPDTLRRELNERSVDLMFIRGSGLTEFWIDPEIDEKFSFETLYDESFVVLAGTQNPWARRRRIELAELVNEPWALAQPESGWGRAAMAAFRARGLDYPRAMVVSNSPEMRMSLVATGHFLTIVASSMLRF